MPLLFPALRESFRESYGLRHLQKDLIAGLVVGVVALPLGMALAIATGVPPQYGLMTVIIAGLIAALCGGSRFNISGPTAAFVVVLLPIVQKFGFGGLLLAGFMSGLLLLVFGLLRLGKYIHLVPFPVVVGFTSGIGVVIALLQIKDFFGLQVGAAEHTLSRLWLLVLAMPSMSPSTLSVGLLSLGIMLFWPKLKIPFPPHLIALLAGTALAYWGPQWGLISHVDTLGDRFQYVLPDGHEGRGIPALWPSWIWPLSLGGAGGARLELSWSLINQLLGPAFAIAILGALESLLCAVVADRMTGKHHHPNAELIGQGLANVVAPFFGGIPATAAIARTATNIQAGAFSPVSALVHSLSVLLAMALLAPYFSFIPMAVLSALLLVTAWKMSEIHHFKRILHMAPRRDVTVLLVCFGLTIAFDMVIAVTVGLGLAGFLFLRRIARSAEIEELDAQLLVGQVRGGVLRYFDFNGSLFFGAAQGMLDQMRKRVNPDETVYVDMRDVRHIDFSAIVALEAILEEWAQTGNALVLLHAQPGVRELLERVRVSSQMDNLFFE